MNLRTRIAGVAVAALCASSSAALLAAPKKPAARKPAARKPAPKTSRPAPASPSAMSPAQMTPEEARRNVAMLDDAYQEILHAVHNWYPTKTGQPVVAATTVVELQKIMSEKGWPQSRFLAVNAIVMNPNHLPKDAFEKKAVEALKAGEQRVEAVEKGRLRVATVLPTGGGCFSCHWTDSKVGSRAAITWSIPVKE